MKKIILMAAAAALFGSTGLMAQDAPVATLRAGLDFSMFLTSQADSTITYDANDKKSTKAENVFNANNFLTQTNNYTWQEATASWKPEGKEVYTLDSKGRPTTIISYSAAGEEENKTELVYEGDVWKTVTIFTKEGGSWTQQGVVNVTNVKVNSAGTPTLIELSVSMEGMIVNMKMETTQSGNITFSKVSGDMMGAWSVISESKNEVVDNGNPTITKSWEKTMMDTDWKYTGQDHAYFSDHKPGGPSANETITAEEPEWRLNGTTLEVPAAENGIKIYAIVGRLVAESRTSTIDMSTLMPGIYVVKTDKGSFKIKL